jgi:ABC-2 type transport system permease protein
VQCHDFLALAAALGLWMTPWGTRDILPAMLMTGLMLGAIGLLITVRTRRIEHGAGMTNVVIFPMSFTSSALCPPWKLPEGRGRGSSMPSPSGTPLPKRWN